MAGSNTEWESDIRASVAEYNDWYLKFIGEEFKAAKGTAEGLIIRTLALTKNLTELNFPILWENPEVIRGLRMTSSPPWAVDRLIGVSGANQTLLKNMEENNTGKMRRSRAESEINAVINTIQRGYDRELLPWLDGNREPCNDELKLARLTMTDRLALSIANPGIRNEQEARQLTALRDWLASREYQEDTSILTYDKMEPGKFRTHVDVDGLTETNNPVKVQVDLVIKPKSSKLTDLPILIECKSAGDFTNVNKRRKEEADKHGNIVRKHGSSVQYVLYLSGYFGKTYLQYESDAGIKWVWHHRIDDIAKLGV